MGKKSKYAEPRNYDMTAGKQHANVPRAVTISSNYRKLTLKAKALLLDAATMMTGQNNGDISLSFSLLKKRGWANESTLLNARSELLYYGFIEMTKRGESRKPDLFALSWWNIHQCGGKLSAPATKEPAKTYQVERPKYRPAPKKKTNTIQKKTLLAVTTGEVFEHEYH